jgi:uncharacterized coiled-coil DUF342 family protein
MGTIIGAIITVLAGIIGLKFKRKKDNAEVEKTIAETEHIEVDADRILIANMNSAIAIYKTISDDLKKEMGSLRGELNEMRIENAALKLQMKTLQQELEEVRLENEELKKQIIKLGKTLNNQ